LLTWLTGAAALESKWGGGSLAGAFMLKEGVEIIGIGAWLGTIMLFNVWGLIWPNQKKILGLGGVEATDEEKAKATKIALMASRTNTLLSSRMRMCMVGAGRGLPCGVGGGGAAGRRGPPRRRRVRESRPCDSRRRADEVSWRGTGMTGSRPARFR